MKRPRLSQLQHRYPSLRAPVYAHMLRFKFPRPRYPSMLHVYSVSHSDGQSVIQSVNYVSQSIRQSAWAGIKLTRRQVGQPRGGSGTRHDPCRLISRLTGTCGLPMTVFMCGKVEWTGGAASEWQPRGRWAVFRWPKRTPGKVTVCV